ncbi:MAG TPA: hypothetical protein VGL13_05405 [Polyangiaceae bacterium]
MRGPVVLGLVALAILAGLPIYLWRKPKAITVIGPDAGARVEVERDAGAVEDAGALAAVDAGAGKRVALTDARTVRCFHPGGGRVALDRCDSIAPVNDALVRAIRDNAACAPSAAAPFSVSFVWTLDFERRTTHLWAGKSGSLKKRSSADLIRCVERALGAPEWNGASHQFAKYEVNVVASYPGSITGGVAGGT